MRIYVASSWRNEHQSVVVQQLRDAGFEVYDFKNPKPGDTGFHWSEIDPEWKTWDARTFRIALNHEIAVDGFASDFAAMEWADACVLVLPCGRSAHLEAGYFVGHPTKRLVILLGIDDTHVIPPQEPELMYRMADAICVTLDQAIASLRAIVDPVMVSQIVTRDGWPGHWQVLETRVEDGSTYYRVRCCTPLRKPTMDDLNDMAWFFAEQETWVSAYELGEPVDRDGAEVEALRRSVMEAHRDTPE